MESSAPKRRKTSPTTAVPVNPRSSAASKKRPSFASPTKASLERHNPEILRRRESEGPPKKPGPGEPNASVALPTSNRARGSRSQGAKLQPERKTAQDQGTISASLGQSHDKSKPKSDIRDTVRGSTAPPPGQLPVKPTPRPLPPPEPEEEPDDVIGPSGGHGRLGIPPGVLPRVAIPEPELPPVPKHDPVVSTPPSGIHRTPTKRSMKGNSLLGRIKSSPLKLVPSEIPVVIDQNRPVLKNAPGKESQGPDSQGPQTDTSPQDDIPRVDSEQIDQYEALLSEVARLGADVEVVSKENERMRQAELNKASLSHPPNADELLQALYRALGSPDDDPRPALKDRGFNFDWTAELDPVAFLPFGLPTSTLPSFFLENGSTDIVQSSPVSRHPRHKSAKEELKFLQAFTPLTFTSRVILLPKASEDPEQPLLQKHSILVTSAKPVGFFLARIEMTINTRTQKITELAVPRIDPAAVEELMPFIESIARRHPEKRATTRNVSVLTWAMGQWLRVSVRRAKLWRSLERELGSRTSLAKLVIRLRERKKRRRPRQVGAVDGDGDGADASEAEEEAGKDDPESRSPGELLPYLGKTSLDLEIPRLGQHDAESSHLRVNWKIEFDWTGDARCKMGILVSLSKKWHKGDNQGKLPNIPALFDKLLEEGENPADAVRTVAALLAGEER